MNKKDQIDTLIKDLEKLKERDDVDVSFTTGLYEEARLLNGDIYYKAYTDIHINYNKLFVEKEAI